MKTLASRRLWGLCSDEFNDPWLMSLRSVLTEAPKATENTASIS